MIILQVCIGAAIGAYIGSALYGFLIKRKCKNDDFEPGYTIRCPFHEEHTPSCVIDSKGEKYHCFGCGKKGMADEILEKFKIK